MRPVIIISGASSSLGVVLCNLLILDGYKVYAGYNLHPGKLSNSKYQTPVKIDVSSTQSCHKTVLSILKKEKSIFGLINLVAISPSGETLQFSSDDFQNILDVNTVGPFRLIREVLPYLKKSGRIINIGSLSGLISFPRFSLYSASKFAIRAMSLSMYYEWLPKERFVTHIAPGAIAKYPVEPPPPGSARNRVPLLNWLLPLVTPQVVSSVIVNCLKNPSPPAEILVGTDAILLSLIRRLSPEFVWNKIQYFVWQKQQ